MVYKPDFLELRIFLTAHFEDEGLHPVYLGGLNLPQAVAEISLT
jgi:hypothetical protein